MLKGTSLDKVTLNSENIKPIAFAFIELCFPEGIRQAGRRVGWLAARQAGRRAGGWAGGRGVGGQADRQAVYY